MSWITYAGLVVVAIGLATIFIPLWLARPTPDELDPIHRDDRGNP